MDNIGGYILAFMLIIDSIVIYIKAIILIFGRKFKDSEQLVKYSKMTISLNFILLLALLIYFATL